MLTISVRNVNEALPLAMLHLSQTESVRAISPRGTPTIEYPTPVSTTYRAPRERVLFNPARHANPFFHLMESLWILDGGEDVAWLAFFNSRMREYSDNGLVFHGAYGYRLRYSFGFDQLTTIRELFAKDIDTRRAVLSIWNPVLDLGTNSKDIPCNDLIFLKVRDNKLHITVCCRSNDVIWGTYGANVVQFSMLQEVMAAMIGVEIGSYTQISDSFHVYPDNPLWQALKNLRVSPDYYADGYVEPYPVVADRDRWFNDLRAFMDIKFGRSMECSNPFFNEVALPVRDAWASFKYTSIDAALKGCDRIAATDWRLACTNWLLTTADNRKPKST